MSRIMNRLQSSICLQCHRNVPSFSVQRIFSRSASVKTHQHTITARSSHPRPPSQFPSYPPKRVVTNPAPLASPRLSIAVEDVADYLGNEVASWSRDPRLFSRLNRFGISTQDMRPLLSAFVSEVRGGNVISALQYSHDELSRIVYDLSHSPGNHAANRYLTKILFEWAAHPSGRAILAERVSASTLSIMAQLFEAADLSRPWAHFPQTRASRRRKIIMHVGPTNSGKTHNALRALAAAERGVYAGPLRLLAHEIWERLNKGQIVPLGVDTDAEAEVDSDTNIDVGDQSTGPIVRKDGNEKYARPCNMITGEEQKIVSDASGLLSCTVEMLPMSREYDVAIVDEIQLIADTERGSAWTSAVLGLDAAEIHLCGEETAVPLIQAMIRDTDDDFIVRRYERLSPLRVADSSLGGDLSLVEKGDCVVAFSRKQIFSIKKKIEQQTNMRCAVAYGRLPPEIRSEQAALFNRPDSGYDVLVGSDAVGMGLNLKIKRIIFEAVRKFDGMQYAPLSISQTKQIAGRAGRYGKHGSGSSGGIVTTLEEADLPFISKALAAPMEPLRFAIVPTTVETYSRVTQALPVGVSTAVALEVHEYVSKMHPLYRLHNIDAAMPKVEFVDAVAGDLTLPARLMLENAPTPMRDEVAVDLVRRMMVVYRRHMRVTLIEVLKRGGLWDRFKNVLEEMKSARPPSTPSQTLSMLESLHKAVVVYLWLSYRTAVAFPDQDEAHRIRTETENAMDWCLEGLTAGAGKSRRARRADSSNGGVANEIRYSTVQEARKRRASNFMERQDAQLYKAAPSAQAVSDSERKVD